MNRAPVAASRQSAAVPRKDFQRRSAEPPLRRGRGGSRGRFSNIPTRLDSSNRPTTVTWGADQLPCTRPPASCPGGTSENSPAFQRRDQPADKPRPEGTAESAAWHTPARRSVALSAPSLQASLRDAGSLGVVPGAEAPGYSRVSLRDKASGRARVTIHAKTAQHLEQLRSRHLHPPTPESKSNTLPQLQDGAERPPKHKLPG